MASLATHFLWAKSEEKKFREEFFLAVKKGSVAGLKEILAETGPEVAAEIVKSFNRKGETPLLLAIKGQHFQMVQYLVDELKADIGQLGLVWYELDCMKAPPLLAAILYDNSRHQNIANYLMDRDSANASSVVLNSIHSSSIPQQRKTNLLKLVGASYLLKNPCPFEFLEFGKKCWSDAMTLRCESTSSLPERPHQLSEWARNVFGNALEFKTMEELEEISGNQLKIQALLIIERIGKRFHPGPHPFFLRLLFDNVRLLSIDDPSPRLNMLMLILEALRAGDWQFVINYDWAKAIVRDAMFNLIVIFVDSHILPPNDNRKLTLPSFMDVLLSFSRLHYQFVHHPVARVSLFAKDICEWMIITMFNMNSFKDVNPLKLAETEEFKEWLSQYIRDINGHSGVATLLHAACRLHSPIELIRLLLGAGADATATDENGWAPLHFLFHHFQTCYQKEMLASVYVLLKAGSHMDQANADGQTPLDLCKSLQLKLNQQRRPDPQLDSLVNKVLPFSLGCFCAQVIVRNKTPFEKLPPQLKTFVVRHGGKI